jgi:putative DNA primase/helicase
MADEKELSQNVPQEPNWVQEAYVTESPPKKPGKSPRKRATKKGTGKVIGRTPTSSEHTKGTLTKTYNFTEMGNKERMFDLFGENIRFSAALGFTVWNGIKWVPDGVGRVSSLASDTIKSIYEEASNILLEASETDDEEERKRLAGIAEKLTRWGKASETLKMVNSMVGLLKNDQRIQLDVSMFDSNPYLFNFANGTVDVRTAKIYPHKRDDYLTMSVPFNYNPDAKAPVFMQFLRDIMLNREELISYLQKAFGLCMTADASEQVWFLLLGSGENGKSTLLEAIGHALGEYAQALESSSITELKRNGSSATPDLASLRGKRLVRVSETNKGAKLDSELIKKMTGQDTNMARHLYRDPFTFKYTHKLFLFTNHEPIVEDASVGFWRRVRKIPFDYRVTPDKKDKQLTTKLESEVEGILAWMVCGYLLKQKEGIEVPQIVASATQKYQEEQDILGTYIRTHCIVDASHKVKASIFRSAYNTWLEEEMGMKTVSRPKLNREMQDRGYIHKDRNGISYYLGLTLPSASDVKNMPVVDPTIEASTLNGNGHTNGNGHMNTLDAELSSIEGL